MKELLLVGDPTLQVSDFKYTHKYLILKKDWYGFGFDSSIVQWLNQREGSFLLRDQDGLATKWECYKKLHKMKAQVR